MSTGLLLAIAGRLETAKATKKASQDLLRIERSACRCPHCESVIYSRRFSTCRECGGELPDRARFAPAQAARVQAEVAGSLNRMHRLDASFGAIQPIGTFRL